MTVAELAVSIEAEEKRTSSSAIVERPRRRVLVLAKSGTGDVIGLSSTIVTYIIGRQSYRIG